MQLTCKGYSEACIAQCLRHDQKNSVDRPIGDFVALVCQARFGVHSRVKLSVFPGCFSGMA